MSKQHTPAYPNYAALKDEWDQDGQFKYKGLSYVKGKNNHSARKVLQSLLDDEVIYMIQRVFNETASKLEAVTKERDELKKEAYNNNAKLRSALKNLLSLHSPDWEITQDSSGLHKIQQIILEAEEAIK